MLVEYNPYDYYEAGSHLFTSYSILIFFFLVASRIDRNITLTKVSKTEDFRVNLLLVFCAVYFLGLTALRINLGLSTQEFRNLFFYNSTFGFFSSQYFIYATILLNSLIWIGLLTSITSQSTSQIGKYVISYVLLDSASGGRMAVFYLAFLLITTVLLTGKIRYKYPSRAFIKTTALLTLIIFGFMYVTIMRIGEDGKSFLEFLYQYLIGPSFLYQAEIADSYVESLISRSYMAWFASLDWAIIGFLKILGSDLNTLFVEWNPALATGRYLNSEYGINAHYTGFLYFALSFGIFSEILIGVLFAVSILVFSKRCPELAIYLGFILTMMPRENLLNSPQFIIILLYFLFIKRNKRMPCPT